MKRKEIFHSPTKGKMDIEKVAKEISNFIKQKPGKYQLVVGTDSEGSKRADFITAIIAHRIGKGGIYFWKRTNGDKIYHTLRQRIYEEVNLSLRTAQKLLEFLGKNLHYSHLPGCDLQIHIDVGENGPTKDIIKEVVGIVRGNGFEAKIKPESYGASIIADKHI